MPVFKPTPISIKPLPPSKPALPKASNGEASNPVQSPSVTGECAQAPATAPAVATSAQAWFTPPN